MKHKAIFKEFIPNSTVSSVTAVEKYKYKSKNNKKSIQKVIFKSSSIEGVS